MAVRVYGVENDEYQFQEGYVCDRQLRVKNDSGILVIDDSQFQQSFVYKAIVISGILILIFMTVFYALL